MTIKIGITGARGTIGQELLKQYPNSVPLVGDITHPQEFEMAVKSEKPDVIVHLAFLSNVDYCEAKENFREVVAVNVNATLSVAEIAAKHNCGMMFMSSVNVFDGLWGNYREGNKPHPKNFYGLTKMTSEKIMGTLPNMKVVRTSYVLSDARLNDYRYEIYDTPHDYPTFMSRSFMYLPNFVQSLCEYLNDFYHMPDILHISGSKTLSWFDFMNKLALSSGIPVENVVPRRNELYGAAPRPHRGGLNVSLSKKLGITQSDYTEALK